MITKPGISQDVSEMVGFIQEVTSKLVKSNEYVIKSIIFASHNISGIFSKDANSVLPKLSSRSCLGITEDEVKMFKKDFKHDEALIKKWYNNYGNSTYNAYSLSTYWSREPEIRQLTFGARN